MPHPPVLYARTRISPEMHSYLMCSTRTQEAVSAATNYYLHYYLLLTQTLLCFNIYVLWLIFSDISARCQELHVLLLTTGELTVELHVEVSGIYNICSSVLSYPFYIIAYTLDTFRFILICMLLWQCDISFPH